MTDILRICVMIIAYQIIRGSCQVNGYITVKDVAEKWNMSVRSIQNLCAQENLMGL